jgi:hypothetical protein
LLAWAFALVLTALNNVDFPTFGSPTMPAFKAIEISIYCSEIGAFLRPQR